MANCESTLFEEPYSDVFVVLFYSLVDSVMQFHRWLQWCFFKISLYSVAGAAEDWFSDHHGLFLSAQVFLTWSLISYRVYRRLAKPGEEEEAEGGQTRKDSSNKKSNLRKYESQTSDNLTVVTDDTKSTGKTRGVTLEFQYSTDEDTEIRLGKDSEHHKDGKDNLSSNVIERLVETGSLRLEDSIELEHTMELKSGGMERKLSSKFDESEVELTTRPAIFASGFNPEEGATFKAPVYKKSPEMRRRLLLAIKDILLFRALDAEQLKQVVDAMRLIKVKEGKDVIREGDVGDYFYVVERGVFEAGITKEDGTWMPVKRYEGSGSFGELGLMYDQPRAATVRCLTDGRLWALDRRSFRKLVLRSVHNKRLMYEEFVASVPLLRNLTEYERQQVVDALVPLAFPKGAVIVGEGDEADGMYFIVEGTAKVLRSGDGGERGTLEKGDYFGEMALINQKPRAASVVADSPVLKTAFLDRGAFERLLGPCLDLMKRNIENYN